MIDYVRLCPFCASSNVEIRSYQGNFRVGCSHCQSLGPIRSTEQEAMDAWSHSHEVVPMIRASVTRPGPTEFKSD